MQLLRLFQSTKKNYSTADLLRIFRIKKKERRPFLLLLDSLISRGILEVGNGGRFSLPLIVKKERGLFAIDRRGDGLVRLFSGGRVTVPIGFFATALPGDEVEVGVWDSGRSHRLRGTILLVCSRQNCMVPGELCEGSGKQVTFLPFGNPSYPKFKTQFQVDFKTILDRDRCWATPSSFDSNGNITHFDISALPPAHCDPEVAYIAARSGAPVAFSPEVYREIESLDADSLDDLPRQDLTSLPFVTIDGEDAKDFDDAVAVVREGKGFRLWVAIADVASYVRKGSALDNDAFLRGNSIYPVDCVIPMLPSRLSENICSLRPDEAKRVLVAEMEFDGKGILRSSNIYGAMIISRSRMTYEDVQNYLNTNSDPNAEKVDSPQFGAMAELATLLRKKRMDEGSLGLDLPESQIDISSGVVAGIKNRARYFAHSIVEECMLAANRTVAGFLGKRDELALFRIHGGPSSQKWNEFVKLLRFFKLDPDDDVPESAGDLAGLVDSFRGHPSIDILRLSLLRCLQQAQYSENDSGHFALSFDNYCHFTSPIRRYPDLIVHRIIRGIIRSPSASYATKQLQKIAKYTSMVERRAMDIERERANEWKCRYLKEREGEQFDAIISSVKSFGFFVSILDPPAEGFVSVGRMRDDYYKLNESIYALVGAETGRLFQLGAKIRVVLSSVNEQTLDIDFSLPSQQPAKKRKFKRTSKRSWRRR